MPLTHEDDLCTPHPAAEQSSTRVLLASLPRLRKAPEVEPPAYLWAPQRAGAPTPPTASARQLALPLHLPAHPRRPHVREGAAAASSSLARTARQRAPSDELPVAEVRALLGARMATLCEAVAGRHNPDSVRALLGESGEAVLHQLRSELTRGRHHSGGPCAERGARSQVRGSVPPAPGATAPEGMALRPHRMRTCQPEPGVVEATVTLECRFRLLALALRLERARPEQRWVCTCCSLLR